MCRIGNDSIIFGLRCVMILMFVCVYNFQVELVDMETPTPWAMEWTQPPWVPPCGVEAQHVELATRLGATLPAQIPDAGAIPSPGRWLSRPQTSAHLDPVEGGAILPGSTLTCPCPHSTCSRGRRLELFPWSTKSECRPTSSHVCNFILLANCSMSPTLLNIPYKKMPEICRYCKKSCVPQNEEPWTSPPLTSYLDTGPWYDISKFPEKYHVYLWVCT